MSAGPLIVTRPVADAGALCDALQARGFETIAAPLMTIEYRTDAGVPDRRFQGLLVSSANGSRALGELETPAGLQDVLTIAVGETSARAAIETGQSNVVTAAGDVEALIAAALEHCRPDDGPLLYVSGAQTTGELQGRLAARGFDVDRVVAYEAVAAEELPAAAQSALAERNAGGVILYSPRTAGIWCKLVTKAKLADNGAQLIHYCLSDNVAGVIRDAFAARGAIVTANEPSEQAMIAAIINAT